MTQKITIYRYELSDGYNKVTMPKGAEILYAGYQPSRKAFSVWALVDRDEKETTERCFEIIGTGHSFPNYSEHARHCGSLIMPDGFHVFHVFEVECIATEEEESNQ